MEQFYDERGNLLAVKKETDLFVNGVIDDVEETSWTWNESNQMLSLLHSKDENNDGEEDFSYRYEWDYDENNQLSRRYVSHNNDLSINMLLKKLG